MRFRTVAIAAVILALTATAGFAAFQVATDARGEAAQMTVERNDTLAVDTGIRQKLVADTDHDPTAYGANGTETVEYNGTVWEPSGNYTYYPEDGEIEFLRDETGEANITYQYDIPADQVADDQLQTATRGFGNVALVAGALSLVVLLLFIAGFVARRLGVWGGRSFSGR
jgi:hypothetical protein